MAEILVKFHDPKRLRIGDLSKENMERNSREVYTILGYQLADKFGYECRGIWDHGQGDIYVFDVTDIKKAIRQLQKHKNYVEWVEERDTKHEKRWETLDKVIDEIEELRDIGDKIEFSKTDYNKKIDEIIGYLGSIKE